MAKTKRTPIPKSIRFEVFKRDSFRCQYCGKSADDPSVRLEVDHIIPVAKGGDNSIMNLITSCRDCNRGKGARELSDESVIVKQKKLLDDIQERKEIIEMMARWKTELMLETEKEVSIVNNYIGTISNWSLTDVGKTKLRRMINNYGFEEVYQATEIAFNKYYRGDTKSWDIAFNKIGGILYNRKIGRTKEYYGH